MATRVFLSAVTLAAISACAPQVPDSGRGVGFDNSVTAQQQRDAALEGQGAIPVPGSAEDTAAATSRILAETRPGAPDSAELNSGVPPVVASPSNPAPVTLNNPEISDENDFDAVAERQTIESDAARIERNRAQYEVVQPEALPERPGGSQPNIVAFALSTNHLKGQSVYSRIGIGGERRTERNCAEYASSDLAQIDFLSRGGPERDRRGLDPDGDGFACGWDPSPFRKAAEG